jgi:uncharacterized membrane protein
MVILLSLTNYFTVTVPDTPLISLAVILLFSLSLFIFPFRLILIFARILQTELDKYGIFSVAIIGGLTGGSIFYFLVLSRFTPDWSNFLDYALLGVLQSIMVQAIYLYIPEHWKVQPVD